MEEVKIIYEDEDILVVDKPAGIVVFSEKEGEKRAIINHLLKRFPGLKKVGSSPRFGVVHRLDKDTSGILLVAKTNLALDFFKSQFKNRNVAKRYLALVAGSVKNEQGIIETLLGRSPKDRRKQKVFLFNDPDSRGKRRALTEYKVLQRFQNFTLLEIMPKTGRKHQIRAHLVHLGCPIAGDKLYQFKGQKLPENLTRQFLHASYLRVRMVDGTEKEFNSELPRDLKAALEQIKKES